MKSKRIIIFGWADSVHVQRWVKGLSNRGYIIKLISLGGKSINNIETVILPRKGKWSYFRYILTIAKDVERFKPDIIHVHYAGGFGLWSLKTKSYPTLISVWGADVIDLPKRWYYKIIIKQILKKATYISATSKMLKEAVIKILPSAKDKTNVIPFGVNLPSSSPGLPLSNPVKICYIKAHRPKYGPDILLKAMAEVTKIIPDIELNMAGEGEFTERLKTIINNLNLENNVRLVGFINNENIYSFIQKHHFMVMPSIMESESFGVAVLEASACCRAVIASNVGGVSEVLIDGKTGFLVPKGDVDTLSKTIIKLAQDSELMNRLGNAGYNFVQENYTWEKSLDMMTELYDKLLHEKK